MYTIEFHHPHFGWLTCEDLEGNVREFADYQDARDWLTANESPYSQRVRRDGVTVLNCIRPPESRKVHRPTLAGSRAAIAEISADPKLAREYREHAAEECGREGRVA